MEWIELSLSLPYPATEEAWIKIANFYAFVAISVCLYVLHVHASLAMNGVPRRRFEKMKAAPFFVMVSLWPLLVALAIWAWTKNRKG